MAADELGSLFSKVRIAEDGDGILPLFTVQKGENIKVARLKLVRKIMSRRRVNLNGLYNALSVSWSTKKAFKISEIGEKIYLFQFAEIRDLNKALYRGPWNFNNSLLILKRFQASLTAEQYDFSTNPFWVRFFDVPVGMFSEQTGYMIGSSMGKVMEVDEGFHKAIRVRTELEVDKPLYRFKTSQTSATESKKLRIKYERLPEFCCVCGCMGHIESDCELANGIKDAGGKIVRRYGSWLKAELENSWSQEDFDTMDEFYMAQVKLLEDNYNLDPKEKLCNNEPVMGTKAATFEKLITRNMAATSEILKDGSRTVAALTIEASDFGGKDITGRVELHNKSGEDLLLSQVFDGLHKAKRKGKGAQGNRRNKAMEVDSLLMDDILGQGKRKSSMEISDDQRPNKVLIDNSRAALVYRTKGQSPPAN